ncbi:hypothetical protein BUALT_Bualt07G0060500 [Buddleja alternifolia]|uniref:Uncharacterized protein n=1 Tax=Buddleja alternifolia TaxID=168488 RepID=A0AAV6XFA1_9LAMI|nr:hypothetical protein BUALT_Bualt07G0060500 [Buddleja alternifolia]
MDVSNRWNSTYLLLEMALPLKKAFCRLQRIDDNPLESEWEVAKIVHGFFLKTFYEATHHFSDKNYPTSNVFFPDIFSTDLKMVEWKNNEHEFVKIVCDPMKRKQWDSPPFRIAVFTHFSVPADLLELRILVHEVQGCSYPKLKEQEKYFSGFVVELTVLQQKSYLKVWDVKFVIADRMWDDIPVMGDRHGAVECESIFVVHPQCESIFVVHPHWLFISQVKGTGEIFLWFCGGVDYVAPKIISKGINVSDDESDLV